VLEGLLDVGGTASVGRATARGGVGCGEAGATHEAKRAARKTVNRKLR
jgi:hypothetical protein